MVLSIYLYGLDSKYSNLDSKYSTDSTAFIYRCFTLKVVTLKLPVLDLP